MIYSYEIFSVCFPSFLTFPVYFFSVSRVLLKSVLGHRKIEVIQLRLCGKHKFVFYWNATELNSKQENFAMPIKTFQEQLGHFVESWSYYLQLK